MEINDLVTRLSKEPGCSLLAPDSGGNRKLNGLPTDLAAFYKRCGGAKIFADMPFGIEVVGPSGFVPINERLYPDLADPIWEELKDDRSEDWRLIAHSEQQGQYVSLDLATDHFGRCYDSFHETHATPGESPVIARTFTELLLLTLQTKGEQWYWTVSGFEGLGDAYD